MNPKYHTKYMPNEMSYTSNKDHPFFLNPLINKKMTPSPSSPRPLLGIPLSPWKGEVGTHSANIG